MTTEYFNGSSCTGSDGEQNRTLTLSNSYETSNDNFQVFVNNSFLHLTKDYTVVHNASNTIITFLNYLWDDQSITIIYSTRTTQSSSGSSGILPLDTQLSNNEITYFGDTIYIKRITKLDEDSYGNTQNVYGDSKIYNVNGDDSSSDFYDTNWISQTFTTSTSLINVTSIKIKVIRTGTPSTITIGIQALDSNSKPNGTDLTSGSLDYTDLIDDGDTEWITIPLTAYTLSASTGYAIVIREASGDSSNKYSARIKSVGTYSDGNNLTSDDSGSSWIAGSSDILFDLYGTTSTVAVVETLTHDDDVVKSGQFQSGDKRMFLQNSESISLNDYVYHDGKWYQVDSLKKFSMGDTTYSIEIRCKKI